MSLATIRARNLARRAAGKLPGALGTTPAPVRVPVPLAVLRPPCEHEGQTLELCHTCKGADESRHVRECALHDDKCTRAVVSAKVRACATCPDHAPA